MIGFFTKKLIAASMKNSKKRIYDYATRQRYDNFRVDSDLLHRIKEEKNKNK